MLVRQFENEQSDSEVSYDSYAVLSRLIYYKDQLHLEQEQLQIELPGEVVEVMLSARLSLPNGIGFKFDQKFVNGIEGAELYYYHGLP